MGLLRACADVVLIGSGTLHGSPHTVWTPEHAWPAAAAAFDELRRRRDQPPRPVLAVLSGSGGLDAAHPALAVGAIVLTTDRGAKRLCGRLPAVTEIVVLGRGATVSPKAALQALFARGHRLVLSEAGPRVFGSLLAECLVDELFLTAAPTLAGRTAGDGRPGLVEGVTLLPNAPVGGRLLSVHRQGSHLLLRYALARSVAASNLPN